MVNGGIEVVGLDESKSEQKQLWDGASSTANRIAMPLKNTGGSRGEKPGKVRGSETCANGNINA